MEKSENLKDKGLKNDKCVFFLDYQCPDPQCPACREIKCKAALHQ